MEEELTEPEVHIIEKYYQEILHCFTMTNIKCKGNKEIDLLAINPRTLEKYHVEARISTARGFALREKDTYTSKGRAHRRGLDYFSKKKFNHSFVTQKIREIFSDSNYRKILVVWSTEDDFKRLADIAKKKYNIELFGLRNIIFELIVRGSYRGSRDDILRTLELATLERSDRMRGKDALCQKFLE